MPIFKDEPLRTVYRHWICGARFDDLSTCQGEMIYDGGAGYKTGDGRFMLGHVCNACARREMGEKYPRIIHVNEAGTGEFQT